jgi:predicted TIM-barrel fold metal-dependent hydrolase
MRYIDCFNHFFPPALWQRMQNIGGKDIAKRMAGIPAIYDVGERLALIEHFQDEHDYTQVISLGMPPIEAIGDQATANELAKIANDGLAELVAKHPGHFCGWLASLPMDSPGAARELERAFAAGAGGVQIHSNINGAPLDEERFFPVFEVAAKAGRPVFLHPSRGADMPDYKTEDKSKYEIWWTFGWPYETSTAMARLVFSGIIDRLPELRVLAHHLGAMIPYFEGRVGPGWDQLGKRTSDENLRLVLKGLKRRPFDYFKDFYADTAVFGSRAATICGLEFYGADRVLFASDCPFDPERGPGYIRDTIAIIETLEMSETERDKICFGNAETLLGIPPAKSARSAA